MSPKVHPCVCGFMCGTYTKMKRHRQACVLWRERPNPQKLQLVRRKKTQRVSSPAKSTFCDECGGRSDHHVSSCSNSQAEVVRRASLLRHGIDPVEFAAFLRILKKRYDPYEI